MKTYKDLVVWQKSMDLAKLVYSLVKKLPKEELYGLSDQMRRAAISIPSNIAEGQGRKSPKEFIQFLSIARGSCYELQTQIELAGEIGFLTKRDTEKEISLCMEISRMLNMLIKSIDDK